MAAKEKPGENEAGPGSLEDAHFRMDELERKHESMLEALDPKTLSGFFAGAAAATLAEVRQELAHIRAAQLEDVDTDRQIIEQLKATVQELRTLAQALHTPIERTSTVMLPSGPVSITTKERR